MSIKIDNKNSSMLDVRPVSMDGVLNLNKNQSREKIVDLRTNRVEPVSPIKESEEILKDPIYFQPALKEIPTSEPIEDIWEKYDFSEKINYLEEAPKEEEISIPLEIPQNIYDWEKPEIPQKTQSPWNFIREHFSQKIFVLAGVAAVFVLVIFGLGLVKKGISLKSLLLQDGKYAYTNLVQAKESILNKDFSQSSFQFQEAYENFNSISEEINGFGGVIVEITRFLPFLSKLSSGKYLAEAGKDISRVGLLASEIVKKLDGLKNPLAAGGESISLLKIFQDIDKNAKEIVSLLENIEGNIQKIDTDDIPEEQRLKFIELKEKLPEIKNLAIGLSSNSDIIEDVLGGNGPRKYLFLFQNNQEMRATGGFIGTYGILDIFDGHIKKFFIDGIFNPDGQLREKIIPPFPIQKISANWSLHDSNWFPDFPVSAEKAAWFYEKTGRPTIEGVITMTPTVMKKLLTITGPIEMTDYGVTINQDNFLENIQEEVEVNYDKELNQPKKILADLAPIVLDRIFNAKSFSDISQVAKILQESLNEKQILIYSKNYEIEKKLSALGWSGEVIKTEKDYLSVINSNINGYKTDGVVDEKIEIKSMIQDNGEIINEVTITRKHNGGNLKYDWWNRVNADYMRVYVPKGSRLISAEGQTREFNSPPLDYKALNFKRDSQVEQEEAGMQIDKETGTRIYTDAGKTVFANWVYVSPQETVVVKYKYLLPFRINVGEKEKNIDTYSLVAQKQSGSLGSKFIATIEYPSYYNIVWKYPETAKQATGKITIESDLIKDRFIGIAFSK